jgi:hypothetical protein
VIIVATLLWDANDRSFPFSRAYDETWAEKLYRQVARNLTRPFRFVVWTDRDRAFAEPAIEQRRITTAKPSYPDCVQPYEASDEAPMILMGLDTMVVGDIDALADYCETGELLALPRDPYHPDRACNGVALIPAGHGFVWNEWNRSTDDMTRCREVEHVLIDDLFPGWVRSYKGAVKLFGLGDARVVYFHGEEKPEQLGRVSWVREHWR